VISVPYPTVANFGVLENGAVSGGFYAGLLMQTLGATFLSCGSSDI